MSEVDLSAAILRYEEPVMYLVLKENTLLNPANLTEIANTARQLSAGKPYLLFSDARVRLSITPDGQGAASDRDMLSLVGANAILVDSSVKSWIANLWIRFSKTPFPLRLFTSASKALSWLEMQKKLL